MSAAAAARLLDLLAARHGLVCAVGAGGKKTTLYRLVEAHRAAGSARIGLTCTVAMAPPPAWLGAPVIAEGEELVGAIERLGSGQTPVVYAQPSPKPGRVGGVPPELLVRMHAGGAFTVTLVKADGARMRWIKAPATGEPVLPPGSATVLPLVSAKVFGQPLTEGVAHRLQQVSAVTGAQPGERLSPEHVARLLSSEQGALHGVGSATVVPVINMVDDPAKHAAAREAARLALASSNRLARIVLACMTATEPVIEVVTP